MLRNNGYFGIDCFAARSTFIAFDLHLKLLVYHRLYFFRAAQKAVSRQLYGHTFLEIQS